jgi:hypothetical protein
MTADAIANVAEFAWEPERYMRIKKEAQYALDVAKAVKAFADRLAADPTFLLSEWNRLPSRAAEQVGTGPRRPGRHQSRPATKPRGVAERNHHRPCTRRARRGVEVNSIPAMSTFDASRVAVGYHLR